MIREVDLVSYLPPFMQGYKELTSALEAESPEFCDDTLESRRSRVQSKWFSKLPYTLRILLQKLVVLCGNTDFKLTYDFDTGYTLTVETGLELFGQVEELEEILDTLLPCNIVASTRNTIPGPATGTFNMVGGISFAEDIYITS